VSVNIYGSNGIVNPGWTTATRPTSPNTGQVGFNTTLKAFEQYNGSGWTTIASWTTANRPSSPVAGYQGYNTSLLAFEFYNGTSWIGFNSNIITVPAVKFVVPVTNPPAPPPPPEMNVAPPPEAPPACI